jgi:outer membrane protein OmpU
MRKLLLGSTALVAAIAFAPAAHAELEVNLGGFVTTQAGFFDNDQANSSDRDFRSKSEIRVRVDGETESGLKYGARIDLLTSTSNTENARRTGLFAESGFGRVELGDLDGASGTMSVNAPTVGVGQVNGSYVNFIPTASRPAGSVVDTGGGMIRALDTDQATKVTYYTPRMSGFQAGISYAPEVDDQNSGEQVQFSDNTGNQHNAIEAGLNYRTEYSNGVRVRAGATFTASDAKDGSGREDVRAWGLGLQVGYKDFTVGGGYIDNGDSNNNNGVANDGETAWNIGGRYTTGPWGVAVSYIAEDYESAGGRGVTTAGGSYDAFIVGGSYKIADGLTTGADLAFFDRNRDTGADEDGYVLVLETKASF